jgi:DNA-binding response OmpR family regulator
MGHLTILIVDDNKDILHLLETELSTEGFNIMAAENGRDAFLKAQNFLPDLILMDVDLPDINGGQAIKLLKTSARTKNIPVIFLTAMLTREEEKEGVTVEGVNYLTIAKPIDIPKLFFEINRLIHVY